MRNLTLLIFLFATSAPAATRAAVPWSPFCEAATMGRVHRVLAWGDDGEPGPLWNERELHGRTLYRVVPAKDMPYLMARSSASASALYHEFEPIPAEGLRLGWAWKVVEFPAGEALTKKSGDDRAASVAVVFHKGWLPWQTRSIFYVWSASLPEGTVIPNPYTSNVRMIVLRSGERDGWVREERDIVQDHILAFGSPPETIQGVGVLTDSDNTASRAEAAYGALYLARSE